MTEGLIAKNLIDSYKVTSMMEQMTRETGRVPGGIPLFEPDFDPKNTKRPMYDQGQVGSVREWAGSFFGDFSDRYLVVPEGSQGLDVAESTAIGGICALRTRDLLGLKAGLLSDPATGIVTEYQSAEQVGDWLEGSVGIDQLVEAIGFYSGDDYLVMSEEKLWGERLQEVISARGVLSKADLDLVGCSFQEAERVRKELLQRYMQYVLKKDVSINFVKDGDVYDDLVRIRDEMLQLAGFSSVQQLQESVMLPAERAIIPGYSVVWGMYTGMYVAMLQDRGYLSRQRGVILEPWMHATADSESRSLVNKQVFGNGNEYLKPGPNENVAFAGYYDLFDQTGTRMRVSRTIDGVPNRRNYMAFAAELRNAIDTSSLDLKANPAFLWGANLLPYSVTRDALLRMISIKDQYKLEREAVRNSTGDKRHIAAELKEQFSVRMRAEAEIVTREIENMLMYVFGG